MVDDFSQYTANHSPIRQMFDKYICFCNNYNSSHTYHGGKMGCPRFGVQDKVRFEDSPFLRRSIGCLAEVQLALKNKKIYTVTYVEDYMGDQFVQIRTEDGNYPFSYVPLNAHLFEKA